MWIEILNFPSLTKSLALTKPIEIEHHATEINALSKYNQIISSMLNLIYFATLSSIIEIKTSCTDF